MINLVSNIADIKGPVLVQLETGDTIMPPSFSQNLANQLQTAGKNVDLHIYPGADHNLAPNTTAAVQEAIAFFGQHIK